MRVALFLWRTIRTQRYRRQETAKPQQDREMTRRTAPAAARRWGHYPSEGIDRTTWFGIRADTTE
jgi:hypothetical protein